MPTLATFNANNFFLRYRFAATYPGDLGRKSAIEAADVSLGYVPEKTFGKAVRSRFVVWDPARRDLAAQALAEPDGKLPDILCLQEVENLDALRILNERHFGSHYRHAILIDGRDARNIDVGVLSVYPILDVRSHIDDVDSHGTPIFSRDCLEVSLRLGKETLTVFVNHLKSKFVDPRTKGKAALARAALEGHRRRLVQAKYVARLVSERFEGRHSRALYAVVGDFNDTDQSPWLAPLTRSPLLTDVVTPRLPPNDAWTYYYRSRGRVQQIDYILASKALAARVRRAHIERAGLAYRKLDAEGAVLPHQVTLSHFEDDGTTPRPRGSTPDQKVPFPRERYAPIFDDVGANVSDHCPVKIWF